MKLLYELRQLDRWRIWIGAGAAIFVGGVVLLTIGLVLRFQDGDSGPGTGTATEAASESSAFTGDSSRVDREGPGAIVGRAFNINLPPRDVTHTLIIEKIGVSAPVVTMGMDPQNVPHVPENGGDVAWYNFSAEPGAGNAVFGGHLNWGGDLGIFARLDQLQEGDLIRLLSEEGEEYTYQVFFAEAVNPLDRDSMNVLASSDTDMVTLITCGGTWEPDPDDERLGGSYTERVVVQAERVENPHRFRGHIGF